LLQDVLDKLNYLRAPGQSYSDVILPEARDGRLIFVKMVA
jgi:hypothetical protein